MIKQTLLFMLVIANTSSVYGQWNASGDSYSSGGIVLGNASLGGYDIAIGRNINSHSGIKIINTNVEGRTLFLLGESPTGGKYGYIAHHGASYSTTTSAFKASSTTIGGFDVNGLSVVSSNETRFFAGGGGDGYLRMVIKPSGKIGIGISDPQEVLHINGAIRGNGAGGALRVNTEFGSVDIGSMNASWAHLQTSLDKFYFNKPIHIDGALSSYNTLNLDFQTAGIQRVRIMRSNGFVGIGITNPHHMLDVNGQIHSREVIVDMEGWPDYVFDSTYNLPPLSEVEAYIKTNNHLPEIPSEAEVKENGVALGEMNALLLKKIEELTLYLIEQKEQIESQNDLIRELKIEVDQLKVK